MKNLLLLPALLLFFIPAIAQKNKPAIRLKLYGNIEQSGFNYRKTVAQQTFTTDQNAYSFGHFSPAINFSGEKYSQEIELSRLTIGKTEEIRIMNHPDNDLAIPISGETKTAIDIRIRYEFNYSLNNAFKRISPQIGIGTQPYFISDKTTPKISSFFPLKRIVAGNSVYFTPRIVIKMNKKLFIDLNMPIGILDAFYISETESDPTLPQAETKSSTFTAKFFRNWFHLRVGIGVDLAHE
jgi:hypothetical protein